ncbi:glycoside hydrolase family protein [Thiobacillus sp.]
MTLETKQFNLIRMRMPIAALALSAAGFAGIAVNEHYTERAIIPTKNDRPTVGLGSTFRDDGTPVRMGDTITPVKAIVRSINHIAKDEAGLKRCVTAPVSQAEYDVLVDFAYQYGVQKTCASSMVRNINAGKYVEACNAYTLYKYSGGFDCSVPNNKVCSGVWKRNLERHQRCLGS